MYKFKIESLSKESFVFLLQYIINDIGVKKVVFSRKTPTVPPGANRVLMAAETRIDIALSGVKHMVYPDGDNVRDIFLQPGEMHYCPSQYWKIPVWDSSHEMSSVVIRKECIRIIYLKYDHDDLTHVFPKANVFYHTSLPMNEAGLAVIKSLNALADSAETTNVEVDLLNVLLKIALYDLENDHPCRLGKGHITWLQINEYLNENFCYPINRASVAKVFKLTPSYISRLFVSEGGEGFNTTLQRLRMNHAKLLLKTGSDTIKEIADQCGYVSTTSFIATFKKYHGIPPGRYRITQANHKLNSSN